MSRSISRYIIVNAIALDRSGALSILRQFVENIPDDNHEWLIFIPGNVSIENAKDNVRLEPVLGVKPMHKRLWWNALGLDRWLKRHGIEPIACISLQNTGFRVSKKNIPHFIYYHQAIPFYPYRWNPFKGQEKTLWFYKNIYPIFVKLFLRKDTTVFVQLDVIRKGFVKRYRHLERNVEVFYPSVVSISTETSSEIKLSDSLNLFYPAFGYLYKNHKVVYDALKIVDRSVNLYVTVHADEEKVIYTGVIPFEEVCWMYRNCDALLFPSYIETFGLPLIEAAKTGMPIIAADLPYAREVLDGYEGVTFIPFNDTEAWAKAITNIEKGKRYNPIDISDRPGWKKLFESIINKISL